MPESFRVTVWKQSSTEIRIISVTAMPMRRVNNCLIVLIILLFGTPFLSLERLWANEPL